MPEASSKASSEVLLSLPCAIATRDPGSGAVASTCGEFEAIARERTAARGG